MTGWPFFWPSTRQTLPGHRLQQALHWSWSKRGACLLSQRRANVKVMLRCLRKVYVFAMKKSPRIFQQTTGYWWGNEYLLDICTQTSNACVDVDMGRHVGLWLCVKLSTAPQVSWIWCEAVAVATVHWSRWVVPLSEPKDPKTKTLHHASPHWVTECVGPIGSNWCVVHCAATALRPGSHCHHRWHQRHQAKNISDVFRFHTFHTFHVFNSFQLVSTRFNFCIWNTMV